MVCHVDHESDAVTLFLDLLKQKPASDTVRSEQEAQPDGSEVFIVIYLTFEKDDAPELMVAARGKITLTARQDWRVVKPIVTPR